MGFFSVTLVYNSFLDFQFHLSAFHRVVLAPETGPFDSVCIRLMWTPKVQSVQIGRMTGNVPPASLVEFAAATMTTLIVVMIFCGKLHFTEMI